MYEDREYKISEFAAMVGMTPSKIRFYEKAGLFPAHRYENGYRYFTPNDAFRANAFRVLLQYGFSVEEAIAMLDARQETAEFQQSLLDQRERLLRSIDLLNYRLHRVDSALDFLNPQPGRPFAVVDVDDHLYVNASHGADFNVSTENAQEISVFYELLGVSSCARIISYDELESNRDAVDPSYIITMPMSEEHRLADYEVDMSKVKHLTMGKCLRFRRRLTREESVLKENFSPMFEYLSSHGYRLRGDILLMPTFLNLDGKGSDIETLLAPIE